MSLNRYLLCAVCALFLLGSAAGCASPGEVKLRLGIIAEDVALLDEVSSVTLLYWEEGETASRITRPFSDGSISVDAFSPGQSMRMAVELRTATERLLGFGRTADEVEIVAGQDIVIPVEIRRPLVYLSSEEGFDAIDSTIDSGADLSAERRRVIVDGGGASVVMAVPSYDGTALVAITSYADSSIPDLFHYELHLLETSTHAALPGAAVVPMSQPVIDLAITADGHYAIAGHDGPDGGVSIVDLRQVRDGRPNAVQLPLGAIGRVTAGAEDPSRVFALRDRLGSLDCAAGGPSAVLEIQLDGDVIDASQVRAVELPVPVQDIAAADDGSFVVAADSCTLDGQASAEPGTLWQVPIDEGIELAPFQAPQIPNVSAVALWNRRIWAVTSQIAPDDRLVQGEPRIRVVSLDFDGNEQVAIDLPPLSMPVEAPVFSDDGQLAGVDLDADGIFSFDIAVAPGAGAVAILFEGIYKAQGSAANNTSFIPAMDIETVEYILLDVATASPVQRVVSRCDVDIVEDALITNWRCALAPELSFQSDAIPEPIGISVLYGSR